MIPINLKSNGLALPSSTAVREVKNLRDEDRQTAIVETRPCVPES
jgi:hypothetical protein